MANGTLKTIFVGVAVAVGTSLCVGAGSAYMQFIDLKDTVTTQQQQIQIQQQQTQRMEDILGRIDKKVSNFVTVTGFSHVRSSGEDRACILINVMGRASWYKDEQYARITNLSDQALPSVKVEIIGTIQDKDESCLFDMSEKAGRLLGVDANQNVKVRIEPVEEAQ